VKLKIKKKKIGRDVGTVMLMLCVMKMLLGDFELECGAMWRRNSCGNSVWDQKIRGTVLKTLNSGFVAVELSMHLVIREL